MAASEALAGLPAGGVFPLDFSPSFIAAAKGKQPAQEEAIGLRYSFKPASITPSTAGEVEMDKGRAKLIHFDGPNGNPQVFDVREESTKSRECVLIWNPETASFTLSPLSTTLNLTLNRNLSGQPRPPKPAPDVPTQKKRKSEPEPEPDPSNVAGSDDHHPRHHSSSSQSKKKARPSEVVPPSSISRPTKGGKGLPRKSLPTSTARKSLPTKAAVPASAPSWSAAAAAAHASNKYKSAEVIEDSDDSDLELEPADMEDEEQEDEDPQADDVEGEQANEAMDDDGDDAFANMLSAELSGAIADAPTDPAVDDSSEEEESSDDDL